MGPPVPILELAQRLVAKSERDIAIVITGLRPGDKLHESLFFADEVGVRRRHRLISHVPAPPLSPAAVADLDPSAADLAERMSEVCCAGPVPSVPEQPRVS